MVLAVKVRHYELEYYIGSVPDVWLAPADRRPIDPPPIVQLRVIDPAANERRRTQDGSPAPSSSSTLHDDEMDNGYAQSFLQNPYYFMFASLAKPDDDTELHWLKVCIHLAFPRPRLLSPLVGWTDEVYDGVCGIFALPPQRSPKQ